jgi:hypothetical protein
MGSPVRLMDSTRRRGSAACGRNSGSRQSGSPATLDVIGCGASHQQPVNVEHRRHDKPLVQTGQDERTPQFRRYFRFLPILADNLCTFTPMIVMTRVLATHCQVCHAAAHSQVDQPPGFWLNSMREASDAQSQSFLMTGSIARQVSMPVPVACRAPINRRGSTPLCVQCQYICNDDHDIDDQLALRRKLDVHYISLSR